MKEEGRVLFLRQMDGFVPQEDSASRQKAAGQTRQGIVGNILLEYQRCADSR